MDRNEPTRSQWAQVELRGPEKPCEGGCGRHQRRLTAWELGWWRGQGAYGRQGGCFCYAVRCANKASQPASQAERRGLSAMAMEGRQEQGCDDSGADASARARRSEGEGAAGVLIKPSAVDADGGPSAWTATDGGRSVVVTLRAAGGGLDWTGAELDWS